MDIPGTSFERANITYKFVSDVTIPKPRKNRVKVNDFNPKNSTDKEEIDSGLNSAKDDIEITTPTSELISMSSTKISSKRRIKGVDNQLISQVDSKSALVFPADQIIDSIPSASLKSVTSKSDSDISVRRPRKKRLKVSDDTTKYSTNKEQINSALDSKKEDIMENPPLTSELAFTKNPSNRPRKRRIKEVENQCISRDGLGDQVNQIVDINTLVGNNITCKSASDVSSRTFDSGNALVSPVDHSFNRSIPSTSSKSVKFTSKSDSDISVRRPRKKRMKVSDDTTDKEQIKSALASTKTPSSRPRKRQIKEVENQCISRVDSNSALSDQVNQIVDINTPGGNNITCKSASDVLNQSITRGQQICEVKESSKEKCHNTEGGSVKCFVKCVGCSKVYAKSSFQRHRKKFPKCAKAAFTYWDKQKNCETVWIRKIPRQMKKKAFLCTYGPEKCKSSFDTARNLRRHLEKNHTYFKCKICGIVYTCTSFYKHRKKFPKCVDATFTNWDKDKNCEIVKERKAFPCTNCDSSYNTAEELGIHLKLTHTYVKCKTCGTVFTLSGFYYHRSILPTCADPIYWDQEKNCERVWIGKIPRLMQKKAFLCTYGPERCKSSFDKAGKLRKHFQNHHTYIKCKICGIVYTCTSFYKHRKKFPKCVDATFTNWDKDKNCEIVKERKGKPLVKKAFPCTNCDSSYNTADELDIHLKLTHTYVKCKTCGTVYTQSGFYYHRSILPTCADPIYWDQEKNCERVRERKGKPLVEKAYPCTHGPYKCNLDFDTDGDLQKHLRSSHTYGKCQSCGIVIRLGYLCRHRKKFPKCAEATITLWDKDKNCEMERNGKTLVKKAFPCTYEPDRCESSFDDIESLNVHIKMVHKYGKCQECGTIYKLYNFFKHRKNFPKCANAEFTYWDKDKDCKSVCGRRIVKKAFPCTFGPDKCESSYNTALDLRKHLMKCHKYAKCRVCKTIYHLSDFYRHRKRFRKCAKAVFTHWNKEKNCEIGSKRKGKKVFLCTNQPDKCKSTFHLSRDLVRHIRLHHKYAKCKLCGTIYKLYAFYEHRKKFPKCAKAVFTYWDKQKNCESVWIGKIPRLMKKKAILCTYGPDKCNFSFDTVRELNKHLKMIHKTGTCQMCGTFSNLRDFYLHRKKLPKCTKATFTHWDKEKNCKYVWGRRADLLVDKAFPCTYGTDKCKSSFATAIELRQHFSRCHIHGKCSTCGKVKSFCAFYTHRNTSTRCANAVLIPWDKLKNCQTAPKRNSCVYGKKANRTTSTFFQKRAQRNRHRHRLNKWYGLAGGLPMNLECQVFACNFATDHQNRLRWHYANNHNDLNTQWAVNFNNENYAIEDCSQLGCGFKTNSVQLLQDHNQRHLKSFSYCCTLCHQLFKRKASAKEHLLEIHKIFKHHDYLCVYRQRLVNFLKLNAGKIRCDDCGQRLKPCNLKLHQQRMHLACLEDAHFDVSPESQVEKTVDGNLVIHCEVESCDFNTYRFVAFREHALTHEAFKTQVTNIKNGTDKIDKASFECKRLKCTYKSRTSSGLRSHEKSHQEGYTVICVLCHQLFQDMNQLISHGIKTHAININTKALYYDSKEYDDIIRLYECGIRNCSGFVTGVKCTWEEHLSWHLDKTQETFSCKLCSIPLGSGRDLKRHFESSHFSAEMGIKHATVPTTLKCCGKEFPAAVLYILHQRLFHPQDVSSKLDEVYPDYYKKQKLFL